MNFRFVSKFFRILCLVITGYLFHRGCKRYVEDQSSTVIEYRTFQETKQDIYPTITLCTFIDALKNRLGLYDRKKLNEIYDIKDPWEYINFLEGNIWEDKMMRVNYDDVTLDLRDHIERLIVMGNELQVLYQWNVNDENTRITGRGSESSSNSTQSLEFYTSYRHAAGKCVSLDLSVETMPKTTGQLINSVAILFKNIRIPDVNLLYGISYPGQILRGFTLDAEVAWNQRITTGYVKEKHFGIDIIEVFRRRTTFHKSCNKNWKEFDNTVLRNVITAANCRPPHWNISMDYPICHGKEKMKEVRLPVSAWIIAPPLFLKKFDQPCDGILAATYDKSNARRKVSSLTSIHSSTSPKAGLVGHSDLHSFVISAQEDDSSTVVFYFKNDRYKEIRDTRAFDIDGLLGNVGGYIGLFLGFAIWQLPDAIEFIKSKWCTLRRGKIHVNIIVLLINLFYNEIQTRMEYVQLDIFSEGLVFRMPDLFFGIYHYGINKTSPNHRYAENDENISANTNLPRPQIRTDSVKPNVDDSTERGHSKSEDEEPCDKCGRREIPIQIEYMPNRIVHSAKRGNKESNPPESKNKQVDCLKTRMDYSDIRLEIIEKALFSSNKLN